jgi:hypothetical protein
MNLIFILKTDTPRNIFKRMPINYDDKIKIYMGPKHEESISLTGI